MERLLTGTVYKGCYVHADNDSVLAEGTNSK